MGSDTAAVAGAQTKHPPSLTLEEAERHGRLCTVRQLQSPLEQLCKEAKDNGVSVEEELKNQDMNDVLDFIEKKCEPFPLCSSPSDLAELGSGFPLYFQFLQFLAIMSLLLLIVQIPCMNEHNKRNGLDYWNQYSSDWSDEEKEVCSTCLGNYNGFRGAYNISIPRYGEYCHEHDMPHCAAYPSSAQVGDWCCKRWCYVSPECPIAQRAQQHGGGSLYFNYWACDDDKDRVATCPWKGYVDWTVPPYNQLPDEEKLMPSLWPYFGAITPGFSGPRRHDGLFVVYLQLAALFIFLVGSAVHKERIRQTDTKVDANTTAPNDFAITVKGLPTTATEESAIAEFFRDNAVKPDREQGHVTRQVDIVKVVICWDLTEFSDIAAEITREQKTLRNLVIEREFGEDHEQVKKVVARLQRLKELIHSTGPQTAAKIKSTGMAIVIFRKQVDLRDCLERWSGFWPRWSNCEKHPYWGNFRKGDELPRFPNAFGRPIWALDVNRSSNPADVNWVDLGRNWKERTRGLIINGLIMLVLVGLAILLVYSLQLLQNYLKEESLDENGRPTVSVKSGMSVLPALIVSLINMGLVLSSKKLSQREYHPTKTHEAASTAVKMTTALVTNTSLVLFLLNLKSTKWYTSGGLVVDLYWMLAVNVLVPPLSQALDVQTIFKRIVRYWKKVPERITQVRRSHGEKMLKFWEPSEFYSARRYTNALQTFICCAVYQPLMPQGLIAAFIGICLQYIIDKYMLLRIHKRPPIQEGPGLAYISLQTCRVFICFAFPISIALFLWPSFDKDSGFWTVIILVGWAMGFISYVLPDAVQRNILCTCICLRRAKFKVSDDAAEIDYYEAQYFWPANMKYHKSHDLYKELPEKINPENLSPGTGVLSQSDIRDNYTTATEALAEQSAQGKQYVSIATPMLVNRAKPRSAAFRAVPVMEPVRIIQPINEKTGSDQNLRSPASPIASATLMNHADNRTTPGLQNHAGLQNHGGLQNHSGLQNHAVIPGAVGTPPGCVASGPTWEFELKSGAWNKFNDDCHDFVEKRYQEYRLKRGGPTRTIKTCGKDVTLDFEDMVQTVEGSHTRRAIRRLT